MKTLKCNVGVGLIVILVSSKAAETHPDDRAQIVAAVLSSLTADVKSGRVILYTASAEIAEVRRLMPHLKIVSRQEIEAGKVKMPRRTLGFEVKIIRIKRNEAIAHGGSQHTGVWGYTDKFVLRRGKGGWKVASRALHEISCYDPTNRSTASLSL